MRQLTPTEPDEKLIAEGRYVCYSRMPYFDDDAESRRFIDRMIEDAQRRFESEGLDVIYVYDEHNPERIVDWLAPSGVFESWSLHQLSNGFRLLRVDRDGQRGDSYTMLAELLFKPPEQGEQIHSAQAKVDYGATGVGDIHGTASYTFHEDHIMTSRDISRRHVFEGIQSWSVHDEILEVPEGYLVSTGTIIGDSVVIDQMTRGLPKPETIAWPQEDPWHRLYEQAGRPVFVLLRHDGILTVDSGSYLLCGERELWRVLPVCQVQYNLKGQILEGCKHLVMYGAVGHVTSVSDSGITLEDPGDFWYKLADYRGH